MKTATPTTSPNIGIGPLNASAGDRCRSALRGRVVLNAAALPDGAVAEMRNLHGRGTATSRHRDRESAVWCWTGRPNNYTGYAIGARGEVLFTQGLGAEYSSTPPPGPVPMH